MQVTKRNHYNPCFWTALWNVTYYEDAVLNAVPSAPPREQVVHTLNVKSQRVYPTTVERVHYDKNLGIAEITRATAKDFVQRFHPDQVERFEAESEATPYPVYLDFESIFTGIEATPAYQTLLKVARAQAVGNLVEKSFLASFVVLQNLRSHSIMNAMIDWKEEMGLQKFEHLVTLKWVLSDPALLFRMVHPLVTSHWSLYTSTEHALQLCDSPVLVQPASTMVALSPRLLLEIRTEARVPEDQMPTCQRIGAEKLEEHRTRTIGNTFREIIGEQEHLNQWKASPEFQARSELMRDVRRYNTMVRATGEWELWHLNSFGNRP